MSFEDFCREFKNVSICHQQPEEEKNELRRESVKKRWFVEHHDSQWTQASAGGCRNFKVATYTQLERTRLERLKSALYLRLEKRKLFKIIKEGPFGLFENPVCRKISKKEGGLWRHLKISKKKSHKAERGGKVS